MPWSPPTPCGWRGCGRLCVGRFCGEHQARRDAELQRRRVEQDRARGSAASRGYGARWRKARLAFLREHPLCECPDCQGGRVRVRAATVVDHIRPHRGDARLFWDPANWQAMAKACHDAKTAREDGGLGNRRRPAPGGGKSLADARR